MQDYILLAEAIEKLFYPYVEVALHDIEKGKVIYLGNNFSNRKIGDDSILEDIDFAKVKDLIGPYEKINFDGKKLKSISTVLRDAHGKPHYLFCINFDCSALLNVTSLIDLFLGKFSTDHSVAQLFKDDWQEKINIFVHENLKKSGRTVTTASNEEKKKLVHDLSRKGAFKAKNATSYAAHVLKISRATLYNYLNETKEA